jgi:energy-converting hydrogenase B subunit D
MAEMILDVVLVAALLFVALGAVVVRDLFRAVVLFITFGLLMALVWMRLEAPDIALAEAAIGAGLTGALLLDTVGTLRRERAAQRGSRGAHAE